jgi:hypothetical protein
MTSSVVVLPAPATPSIPLNAVGRTQYVFDDGLLTGVHTEDSKIPTRRALLHREVSHQHAAGRITRPLRHNGQPYSEINVLCCAVCCMALLLAVVGIFGVVILIPISRVCWATLQRIDDLRRSVVISPACLCHLAAHP